MAKLIKIITRVLVDSCYIVVLNIYLNDRICKF
jgi:hypothetical protein